MKKVFKITGKVLAGVAALFIAFCIVMAVIHTVDSVKARSEKQKTENIISSQNAF